MIEIHHDTLRFSFPAIVAQIESFLDAHVAEMLPAFLAEDREEVIDQIFQAQFDRLDEPDFVKKACDLARNLTAGQIESLLRQQVHAKNPFRDEFSKTSQVDISFQRTFRVPDDGRQYPLPPSSGRFPLRHLDDFAQTVPEWWLQRGGVLMPMYQSEALWLGFSADYPVAIKIAAGKVNAITGGAWQPGLQRQPQDYVVAPGQPWLDGFAVAEGVVRQFVAMRLGGGYSAEEQTTGRGEFGGIQFQVIPMKARKYYESRILTKLPKQLADIICTELISRMDAGRICSAKVACAGSLRDDRMGLGAGGQIRQQIYKDPHAAEDWDLEKSSRCFVHLCNAVLWRDITGERPPHVPFSPKDYERYRLPWFDFYRDDLAVLEGSKTLASLKSVNSLFVEKTGHDMKGNASVKIPAVIQCHPLKKKTVQEWGGE